MIPELSDFSEKTPARAAPYMPATPECIGSPANQLPADEAALMNILRILNGVSSAVPLTAVERSFVLGAKAMFEELARVCDTLLASANAERRASDKAAHRPTNVVQQSPRKREKASGITPTPGGGSTSE